MSESGCRPDVACICIDLKTQEGTHVGISVTGEGRELFLEQFRQEHSGPGHLPEVPARSWYGREAAFQRHLNRLRAAMVADQMRLDDIQVADVRPTDTVDSKGRL